MKKKNSHSFFKSVGGKIFLSITLITAMAILSVTVFSIGTAKQGMERDAFEKLLAVQHIKKTQIETFFEDTMVDVEVLANNPYVVQAFKDLDGALVANGGTESGRFKGYGNGRFDAPEGYKRVHDRHAPFFDFYMGQYGYYDIFFMCPEHGDVSFSVTKEPDFGVAVSKIDSSLKDVWEKAMADGNVHLSDTKPYDPSGGAPLSSWPLP